jgi:hypothetical protein
MKFDLFAWLREITTTEALAMMAIRELADENFEWDVNIAQALWDQWGKYKEGRT